jgi:hypothetical protein
MAAVLGTLAAPSCWGLKRMINRVMLTQGREPYEEIAVLFRAVASESIGA